MARTSSYLELKPDAAGELLDLLEAVYNNEQHTMQVEHFASIYNDVKEMCDNIHYCDDCNTHYFDHRDGAYNMKCDDCCADAKIAEIREENE